MASSFYGLLDLLSSTELDPGQSEIGEVFEILVLPGSQFETEMKCKPPNNPASSFSKCATFHWVPTICCLQMLSRSSIQSWIIAS